MSLYFHARMFTFRFVVVKLRDEKLMLGRADVAKRPILEVKNWSIKFECSSFVKTKRTPLGIQANLHQLCVRRVCPKYSRIRHHVFNVCIN